MLTLRHLCLLLVYLLGRSEAGERQMIIRHNVQDRH